MEPVNSPSSLSQLRSTYNSMLISLDTELFAGLSEEVKMENNGTFGELPISSLPFNVFSNLRQLAGPWGKMQSPRADIAAACKSDGTGVATQFWDWTEKQVEPYA